MRIAFANDHTGIDMKKDLILYLRQKGHEIIDVGSHDADSSDDYPDFAEQATQMVISKKADQAILLCGSGSGMAIAANKIPGIRCASCTDPYCSSMARKHNNANVLSIRAREMDLETNIAILDAWLGSTFEPHPRHERRIQKISELEEKGLPRR